MSEGFEQRSDDFVATKSSELVPRPIGLDGVQLSRRRNLPLRQNWNKNMGKNEEKEFDLKTIIIIVLLIMVAGLIFDHSPSLPSNCHRTTSVDVGGKEIECD